MSFNIDYQPPPPLLPQSAQIKALTESLASSPKTPPYIPPPSPSGKRKRGDGVLFISPPSANSSFNSLSGAGGGGAGGSFSGEGSEDDRPGSDKPIESNNSTAQGLGIKDAAVMTFSGRGPLSEEDMGLKEVVEIPSPRTKVANKLEEMNIGNAAAVGGGTMEGQTIVEKHTGGEQQQAPAPVSKALEEIKTWRKSVAGRFEGISNKNGETKDDTSPMDRDNHDEEAEINRTPRKKKKSFAGESTDFGSSSHLSATNGTPKNRKGKARAMFLVPGEVEMTPADEPRSDNLGDEKPGQEEISSSEVVGPTSVMGDGSDTSSMLLSRRKLRSPPPSIAEVEEGQPQRPPEELDTDSDPDQTGIGYKPTAQQRQIRSQKRMQQIKEYKARESREARAKRNTERRRKNVTERGVSATSSTSSLLIGGLPSDEPDEMTDIQKVPSSPPKKVHFAD